jgi:hypothetical protein
VSVRLPSLLAAEAQYQLFARHPVQPDLALMGWIVRESC